MRRLISPLRWLLVAAVLAVTWTMNLFSPIGRVLTTLWPPTGPTETNVHHHTTSSTWALASRSTINRLTMTDACRTPPYLGWRSGAARLRIAVVALFVMMLTAPPAGRVGEPSIA